MTFFACFPCIVADELARVFDGDFIINVAGLSLHFGRAQAGGVRVQC